MVKQAVVFTEESEGTIEAESERIGYQSYARPRLVKQCAMAVFVQFLEL